MTSNLSSPSNLNINDTDISMRTQNLIHTRYIACNIDLHSQETHVSAKLDTRCSHRTLNCPPSLSHHT